MALGRLGGTRGPTAGARQAVAGGWLLRGLAAECCRIVWTGEGPLAQQGPSTRGTRCVDARGLPARGVS